MTGNIALDVVIGLVFIYVLYSLFTTTIVEMISVNFQLRSKNLEHAIKRMLDDDKLSFSGDFYKTPLIKYQASGGFSLFGANKKPSYLKSDNFSQALLYLLKDNETPGDAVAKIRATLSKDSNSETCKYLFFLLNEANNDIDKFTKMLEKWFDDTMERCAGWYKKNIAYITLLIGFVIATLFNVDTFLIVKQLSRDPKAREQYIQMAGQLLNNKSLTQPVFDTSLRKKLLADSVLFKKLGKDSTKFKQAINDSVNIKAIEAQKILFNRMKEVNCSIDSARHVLNFERKKCKGFIYEDWLNLFGCLVTAIALSLGAPFWFDMLNKLMKLRSSIAVPTASESNPKKAHSEETSPNAVG